MVGIVVLALVLGREVRRRRGGMERRLVLNGWSECGGHGKVCRGGDVGDGVRWGSDGGEERPGGVVGTTTSRGPDL